MITIRTQKVKTEVKVLQFSPRKGSLHLIPTKKGLTILTSKELREPCKEVIGEPHRIDTSNRWEWKRVSAVDLAEVLLRLAS